MSWNPKITTYPGLYLVSSFFLQILNIACTSTNLRLFVFLISMLLPYSIFICYEKLSVNRSRHRVFDRLINYLVTLLLFICPLNSFYYFLFYTDTLSILMLIIVYSFIIKTDPSTETTEVERRNKQHNRSYFHNVLLFIVSLLNLVNLSFS